MIFFVTVYLGKHSSKLQKIKIVTLRQTTLIVQVSMKWNFISISQNEIYYSEYFSFLQ